MDVLRPASLFLKSHDIVINPTEEGLCLIVGTEEKNPQKKQKQMLNSY